MQRVTGKLLLTGVLAGITAVLLVLGASAQPTFASVLYAASALPVLIVGLGWGNVAAITAVVTAAAIGAVVISPLFAAGMAAFTLLPAGWLAHLANLARPASELGGPKDLLAWYPLSDILFHLCGVVSIAVVLLGVMIGFGPELISEVVDAITASFAGREPPLPTDPAMLEQTKGLMLLMLPIIQGGMWVIMLFAAYYFATRIVSASGHSLRPREDIPSALRMNRNSVFIFLAAIIACFVGGVPALIGATLCGTFGAGFLLSGFASLHLRSRGRDWRLPVLVLCYLASIFILPALVILILGIADTRRTVPLSQPAAKPKSKIENSQD